MEDVLISIKPKYVKKIMDNSKKYEFRKQIFKKSVEKIYVYSTSPVMKIVGYFDLGVILAKDPEKIWEELQEYAGIDKKDFFQYFNDKTTAYAIEIPKFIKLSDPIDPKKIDPNFKPPQSFYYLNKDSELHKILKKV
ncbi:type I restriction enzyme S subunit [Methanococcus maripaludis]|uniref:Type I restriction enzyme S subunit n=1 Tax=Methanococcus maripaludis TaxID=39152 RepID=A0A7J9P605_METMI|nr:hypothetical protein [Methanococcus maripaludis]MBA2858631.1 type I restriction enzyme S subunit [Methanococcus maripaludis]